MSLHFIIFVLAQGIRVELFYFINTIIIYNCQPIQTINFFHWHQVQNIRNFLYSNQWVAHGFEILSGLDFECVCVCGYT